MSNRLMSLFTGYVVLAVLAGLCPRSLAAQPTAPAVGKPPRIVAHYMPWYVAKPFSVCVEHVIDAGSRSEQIRISAALRSALRGRGSDVQIAVDEWCNTLEDIELFVSARAAGSPGSCSRNCRAGASPAGKWQPGRSPYNPELTPRA